MRSFRRVSYTVALKTSGSLGYQYAFPLLRFEVTATEPPAIRELTRESVDESVWPNQRLFEFFNFHVLPHHNPNDIRGANNKVSPAITLRVDNAGTIHRGLLSDAAENSLRWRIYHQGQLVDGGSAAGVPEKHLTSGVGTYQVLIGVEGADGFMPVSNFMEFPLFPTGDGNLVVVPELSPGARVPDGFDDIVTSGDPSLLHADSDGDGLSNEDEAYVPIAPTAAALADPEKLSLFQLWRAWRYDVIMRMKDDPDHPGLLRLR